MPRQIPLVAGALAAAWFALGAPAGTWPALPGPAGPRELLRAVAGLSDREWTAIERGQAVARILHTDGPEIAVAGAVRINAARDALLARYRDIDNLKRSAIVLDAGTFSPVPQPDDLARVVLEDRGLDLRDCRPGDCQVRLGAPEIERFRRDVDWRGPDWRARSASIWRDVLATYAAAYQSRGAAALPVYVNKQDPLSVASELSILVGHYRFVADYSPALHAYFRHFGADAPAGAEHLLYWTKEDFGIRPILRISHQVIHRPPGATDPVFVATNQIYADHYLDAALGVAMALDVPDEHGEGFYMIAVNRARTRSLTGFLRSMVRSTVQGRSREAMRRILSATKAALESEAPAAAGAPPAAGVSGRLAQRPALLRPVRPLPRRAVPVDPAARSRSTRPES